MQRWLKSITRRATRWRSDGTSSPSPRWWSTGLLAFSGAGINAFSLGLLIAFVPPTPLLPLHLTLCLVLGIVFRLNLPVLFATVFISNPLTWFPQVACSVWVGAKLMGLNLMPMLHGLSHRTFRAQIHQLWEPLMLGALVLGICAAARATCSRNALWRGRVIYRLHRRARRLNVHGRALD